MKKIYVFLASLICLCCTSFMYAQNGGSYRGEGDVNYVNNCEPCPPDQNCGECYCLCCHYEPCYYNKWHCNYEPRYTYKKCCRYVTQCYEKQCCRYVPQQYTQTCTRQVPQYYYTTQCHYVPKYTCERCCTWKPKYYYKKTDVCARNEAPCDPCSR